MSNKRRKPTTDDNEEPSAKRQKTSSNPLHNGTAHNTNNATANTNNSYNSDKPEAQFEDKALPRFLQHIWTMLHDSTLKHIISWHQTMPNAFVVHKQSAFCQQILPKFFKHNKFTSFVRQLNMYQFHKLRDEKPMTWSHPYLHKNKYSQLQFIQRRISSSSSSNNAHSNTTHMKCNNNYKTIIQLTNENKEKIVCLQQEIKQIRNDINLKFNQLRQDLMAKFDSLYHQNLNQEMHHNQNQNQNISMGMQMNINNANTNVQNAIQTMPNEAGLRHAPPPINNANDVKKEAEQRQLLLQQQQQQQQLAQALINLDNDSQSTNNSINITRYMNRNNGNNNNNTINRNINTHNNNNTNMVQTPSSVVYVTNGAAQCLPLELIGTAPSTTSNTSPYIIASHTGSPATITLLNIGGNNMQTRTPPAINTFPADFSYNNQYNYNNIQ